MTIKLSQDSNVRDLVELFNSGEIRYADIMDLFSVSRDLIKARLTGIGLHWDNSQKKFVGDAAEEDLNTLLIQLFEKQRGNQTGTSTGNGKRAGTGKSKRTSLGTGISTGVSASKNTGEDTGAFKEVATSIETGTSASAGKGTDILDRLFTGLSTTTEKKEVSFYLTHDVIEVINKAKKGNRSDLVNEALRKVFREKGWL
jgi:hypothetical protein